MHDSLKNIPSSNWLVESWKRSESAGLVTTKKPQHIRLDGAQLSDKKYRARQLINAVEAVANPLFQQVFQGTDSRLILTDQEGVIVGSWGQMSFQDRLHNIALELGVCWQERLKGTNAIGTAITENRTISVIGGEHFIRQHRFISCTATPILSGSGEVLGVLDITSEQAVHGQDTQVLLRNMGQLAENWLLNNMQDSRIRLEFAMSESLLNTGWQGVVIADDSGKVIAHNQFASRMLQSEEIVGLPLERLLNSEAFSDDVNPMVFRTESIAPNAAPFKAFGSQVVDSKPSAPSLKSFTVNSAPSQKKPGFHLHFGDDAMAKVWQQASTLIDKDISLLIHGETGTGKGELVKALHQHSFRSHQPLVAVNCGAIPNELIESELFGYEAGAFTGSNPKGAVGKVRAADKGILFLDEIADMSLGAQCRLLHVLQDSAVMPVGATKAVPVDVRIVAATHKDLPAMISKGEFRQDLYYRLNGLILNIPPLRNRQDRTALIQRIHQNYSEGEQVLSAELLTFLDGYSWPGNLRELDNVLKVATLLSEEAAELRVSHLPEHIVNARNSIKADAHSNPEGTLSELADAKLLNVYAEQGENVSRTAKKLGISRQTLYRKLKRLGYE